ncbi:MAG: helix-turn-helix domain-containing protein [Verrucomicrobiae bacterium]|nr:helix-turn-helix domain-containing protein [Verrucomicrobiae bacterium]
MSHPDSGSHPVARRRAQRGWSQAELAQRAGIPRTTISAIEGERLTPSVTAALALARALECSVEELFAGGAVLPQSSGPEWAWRPRSEPCRFWEAEVGGRRWLYPVESLALNAILHDGVWRGGVEHEAKADVAEQTLVMACCDPAAGLLAAEYAQASGFRLLVFPRCGGLALDLLKRGVIHVAGLHRSTGEHPNLNLETVRERLGGGYRLLRAARWEEGVALPADDRTRAAGALLRQPHRWALREPGSAARECLDEWSGHRRLPGRVVDAHQAVAQAVRAGWASAGVCVKLAAEEAGLNFLPLRAEALDFCFAEALGRDPRGQALIRLLRSRAYRRLVSELPGYDARETGEMLTA